MTTQAQKMTQSKPSELRELVLLPVIGVVFVLASIFVPYFFSANNVVNNILANSAVLGLLVIAQAIILIGGYFDLSMQSVVGLAPMLAAWLAVPAQFGGLGTEIGGFGALLVVFAVGAGVGLFNGFLIARLRMNPFIVTLAQLVLLQGFTLGISSGKTFSRLPSTMTFLGDTRFLGVTLDVWLLLTAFAAAAWFMSNNPTGRHIYAMGGNAAAARANGIKTVRLTYGLYVFGGLMAALAGLALTSRIAAVTANQGTNIIFTVFAAAVIGGISLEGGRGTILGAATGVLLLGIVQNILVLSNIPSFWIDATYGAIILGALLLSSKELRLALGLKLKPE
jgi:simple sugar transport system permease protein